MYNAALPPEMLWNRCAACLHVFTDGYWSPAAVAIINQTVFPNQSVGWDFPNQRLVAAQMVESITAISGLPADSSWLDVGFGNGALLFTAIEYGFRGIGIDIRQPLVDSMHRIGVEAHCGSIESLPAERFDVISMADVVEHCAFPVAVLHDARMRMKPKGLLLVSMPNMGCPVWDYLSANNQNHYWNELEHYHNFSRDRLFALLKACSFQPIRYRASRRYEACMEVIARAA